MEEQNTKINPVMKKKITMIGKLKTTIKGTKNEKR